MVTLNMESRNPMGRVYAENRSKTQKPLGFKGLIVHSKVQLAMGTSYTCVNLTRRRFLDRFILTDPGAVSRGKGEKKGQKKKLAGENFSPTVSEDGRFNIVN